MSFRRKILIGSALLVGFGVGFGTSAFAADYAAKVGKEIISKKDVDQVLKNNPNATDNEQTRRQITEQLIVRELIIQAAKQKKLETNPQVKEAIAANTRQILFTAEVNRYLEANPLRDSMVRAQYDEWTKKYPKEEYKTRHILLKTKEDADQVASQLKDGKPFTELATQSLDTETAKKGGDLGWIAPMIPQEVELLSGLHVGQLSDPIETPNGWNLVEVMEKRPAQPPEFDKIKDRFRAAMQQELINHYVKELQEKIPVVIP